jgi:hypothetical protein
MLMVGAFIAFFLGKGDARPLPAPIAKCDGSGTIYLGSTHSDNEDWFSLTGRVVGQDGAPVCGAEVSATYLEPLETKYGSIEGSLSPTGLNGEFFLANLRKGVPFTVRVNPYNRLEVVIGRVGFEGLGSALKKERNARVSGVGRYSSEELRHTAPAGVMRFDIDLPDDPTATGIVLGEAVLGDPLGASGKATARIEVAGKDPIEVPVQKRTGRFVALGVPAGEHRVEVEIQTKGRRYEMRETVTVPAGQDAVARVQIRRN